jgi:segregation and condensation protein B
MREQDERVPGDAGVDDGSPGDTGGEDGLPGDAGLPGDGLTEAQLEALLFVAERPLARRELMTITGASREVVDARLGDLEVSLASRGLRVLSSGDRVALGTAPEAGALIARYVGSDAVRLSPASLETLAIVAYRQPVTRSVVERIRGVDSDYTIRALLHRRLVVELGRAETPGRPILYGTGFEFLERFGLVSLEELPQLEAELEARLLEAHEGGEPAGPEATEAAEPTGEGAPEPDAG